MLPAVCCHSHLKFIGCPPFDSSPLRSNPRRLPGPPPSLPGRRGRVWKHAGLQTTGCAGTPAGALYVRLLLYTRANPACGRELHHRRFPSEPLFNLSRPTAFVVHGYRPTGAPPVWIDRLVRLLAEGRDLNVVVVDWNRGAANLNYLAAVAYTREASHNLTGFIRAMQEEGASLGSMHLIGVSLGAHLAGFVGANLKGKIGRITGLDPAGPLFTSATPDERLDPSDAMFVDVLHTDMERFLFLPGR